MHSEVVMCNYKQFSRLNFSEDNNIKNRLLVTLLMRNNSVYTKLIIRILI